MLLASEAYFFDEPASHRVEQEGNDYGRRPVWPRRDTYICRPTRGSFHSGFYRRVRVDVLEGVGGGDTKTLMRVIQQTN
jgi:hypothetical protein